MKNFLGIVFAFLLLTACDDGDLTIENISFQDVPANICGETIYKLNGNEALFLKLPAALNAFKNDITLINTPNVFAIEGTTSVRYRAYNGTAVAGNICDTPGPIFPSPTEEWIATSGDIEVSTIAQYAAPNAFGTTKIIKYIHTIVFKNIVFTKPNGTQIYETFSFGELTTTPTELPLNFSADDIRFCSSNNILYNARTNGIEFIFVSNFDTNLLAITNLGVPKTGLISATSNRLAYRLLQSAISTANNDEYFCNAAFPVLPAVNEEWIANDGVQNVSGEIEVTTTTNGNGYLHTILLKKVTFQKENSRFYYGDAVLLGSLLTN